MVTAPVGVTIGGACAGGAGVVVDLSCASGPDGRRLPEALEDVAVVVLDLDGEVLGDEVAGVPDAVAEFPAAVAAGESAREAGVVHAAQAVTTPTATTAVRHG